MRVQFRPGGTGGQGGQLAPPPNILSFDEQKFRVNGHLLSKPHLSLPLAPPPPHILKLPPGLQLEIRGLLEGKSY